MDRRAKGKTRSHRTRRKAELGVGKCPQVLSGVREAKARRHLRVAFLRSSGVLSLQPEESGQDVIWAASLRGVCLSTGTEILSSSPESCHHPL